MVSSPVQLLGWWGVPQRADWECRTVLMMSNAGAQQGTTPHNICAHLEPQCLYNSWALNGCVSKISVMSQPWTYSTWRKGLQPFLDSSDEHQTWLFFVFPAFSLLSLLILRKPCYKPEKVFLSIRITQHFPVYIQDRKDPVLPLLGCDSQVYENV